MSTTLPTFRLLNVLLVDLLVHGMTSLLVVLVPPFIHSCITLSLEVQIHNHLLHPDLKTQGYQQNTLKGIFTARKPSIILKNRDLHLLSKGALI